MRIGVIGAGAVGGTFASLLASRGHEVEVTARGDHLAAIQETGLRLDGGWGEHHAPVAAHPTLRERPELAILATKAQDAATALARRWDSEMMMPDAVLEGAILTVGGGDAGSPQGLPPDTIAGLRKIVDLLGPLLAEVDPPLTATLRNDFAALDRASAEGAAGLQDAGTAVSRDLGAMRAALRVEGREAQP